ncbi:MAG TPA: DUF262 domain-containing protein [Thermoanaerobaculia bacterium]|nr:DUF262 domain-containing protein [Thermoanaerobaculia bacterium]
MPPVFKNISWNLWGLMDAISSGHIGLPDLQRPFVWLNKKARDLFDSMYRGYPVGYFLFWENAGSGGHAIGEGSKQMASQLLVIDGQQRLTSLYAVLRGQPVKRQDFSVEHIQIAFRPIDGSFEVADAAIRKDAAWIADISVIWKPDTDLFELASNYLERLAAVREVTNDERRASQQAIMRVSQLANFPFTALALEGELDEEQVADVFVRINSKGTPLNQADFILTLMSVFKDAQRVELETFCQSARIPAHSGASPSNRFLEPDPDHLLRVSVGLGFRRARLLHVYSILRGKDLETGSFSPERRDRQFAVLDQAQAATLNLQNWHDFWRCLLRAGFQSGSMVTSKNAMLYAYTFFLIGKRDFKVDHHRLRNTIARWFFFVSLTGRYTDSTETKMEQDLADLRELATADQFVDHLERVMTSTLTRDYWTFTLPTELTSSSARSPALSAYHAALNLLDARALFSTLRVRDLLDPAARGKRATLERHHLFPKAHLQKLGTESRRDTNQIANYALIEWPDNSDIGKKPPKEYYPLMIVGKSAEEIQRMAFWHALPKGWEKMDYSRFLEERRKLMAQVVQAGFDSLTSATAQGLEATADLPAEAEGASSLAEQALSLLAPEAAEYFQELLAEPLMAPERLRAEVRGYVAKLESLAAYESGLDIDRARRIGDRCLHLLESQGRSEEESRLVQAAVSHFTVKDDLAADLGPSGFLDDEAAVAAVETVLSSRHRNLSFIPD